MTDQMLERVRLRPPEAPRPVVGVGVATLQNEGASAWHRIVREMHTQTETGAPATQDQHIGVK